MAAAQRIDMLKELYKDDTIEPIENSTVHARVNGRRAYITNPDAQLSVRHELIADLAATGMKPIDISRTLKKTSKVNDTNSGHYNMLLRDPKIRQAIKDKVGDVLDVAKDNLRSSVIKASENITNAVKTGDIKMSQYVLATQGLTEKPPAQTANLTLDFGAWLSSVSNTKEMHEIPTTEVICDSSALPSPVDGDTL